MSGYEKSNVGTESKTTTAKPGAQAPSWRMQLKKSLAGSSYEAARASLQFKGEGKSDVSVAESAFKGSGGSVPHGDRVGSAIGADLSGVSAHTGPAATAACESLGAEAFTYGNNMAFKDPSPTPQLVAHESKHAVHQGAAPSNVESLSTAAGHSSSAMEAEADAAMSKV